MNRNDQKNETNLQDGLSSTSEGESLVVRVVVLVVLAGAAELALLDPPCVSFLLALFNET